MLLMSLGACLFAFVPVVEAVFHLPETTLWMTASVLLGVFYVAYLLYALPARLRLHRTRRAVLPMWATVTFILCLGFAAVLQALNAIAVVFGREPGPYVAGLLLLLMAAGLQFAFLVLTPLSPAEDSDRVP